MDSPLMLDLVPGSDDAQQHALKLQKLLSDPEVMESGRRCGWRRVLTPQLCADRGRSGARYRGNDDSIAPDPCAARGALASHPPLEPTV